VAVGRGVHSARGGSRPVSFEQIEREAIKLFSEKSYAVVGMRDISDTVGILPGSLYAHIANKEELLLNIVRQGIHHYLDALRPISESDRPGPERLRLIMRTYMEIRDARIDQSKVSFYQWTYLSPERRGEIVKLREDYEAIFTRVISPTEFPSLRHPRVAVLGTIGMLNSALRWYTPGGYLTPTEVGDELADMALRGLCR
jgi:AcrR family transcriptional regulator